MMIKSSWWSNFIKKNLLNRPPEIALGTKSPFPPQTPLSSILPSSEHLAQNLPDLLLASHQISRTILAGSHGCKKAGQGNQFWQYRYALPGEAIQTIDWRKSAKGNKTYVKETEEENTQTLYLWCDVSGSMQWHSCPELPTKQNRAFLFGITLSSLLLNGGERIRLLLPNRQINNFKGTHQLYSLAEQLVQSSNILSPPLLPLPEQIAAHTWTILISDFLYPYEMLSTLFQKIIQRPSHLLLIQIADPAEKDLPFKGRMHFTGLEGEKDLILSNSKQSSAHYKTLWTEHQNQLKSLSKNIGIPMLCTFSNHHAAQALLQAWNILSYKHSSR